MALLQRLKFLVIFGYLLLSLLNVTLAKPTAEPSSILTTRTETISSILGHYTITLTTTYAVPASTPAIPDISRVTQTTTTTYTSPGSTVTVYISVLSSSSPSATESVTMSTSTGLCWGRNQDVLTPCSSVITKTAHAKTTGTDAAKKSDAIAWVDGLPDVARLGLLVILIAMVGVMFVEVVGEILVLKRILQL